MTNTVSKSSNLKGSLIIIFLTLVIAITFETLQQLYYIRRYNLVSDVSFFYLLKSQSYSWIIWILFSLILIWVVKAKTNSKKNTITDIAHYVFIVFGLVFLCILTIASLQQLRSGDTFSINLFLNEYLPFFIFQKTPVYTLGYFAITIILYLYFSNEQLQIKVQKLSEIKEINKDLYQQLRERVDDKTTILNIKTGNKRKIIPTSEIQWIEADDYCVKVHTNNGNTHVMRSTLKSLEEKLSNNFLRVHRKAIVNMDSTKELSLSGNPKLILSNDITIPISKSNLKNVKQFLS
ncbi:LytR/AlgR family response regulator transcription factor [Aquimarina sp. 2201CG14-23]|uniref:LytR/AlgR family response regulator transcription factor n=1 Tax=Aquimarina mycalae TaxID=3040073 RepID=UPI0024782DB0|nr:LytTR family transcriptional regulator DNA-binding domain-containing protein [Aquimarina sp. 2201CG14-23]MDH7446792.1 LytTR family transcriptional regulator DNA-binding domain-containing protein [Aquimarina sp. 2201CG14-23]